MYSKLWKYIVKYRNGEKYIVKCIVKYRNGEKHIEIYRDGELGLPATHLSSCCFFIVPVILILFLLDFTISLSNF